MTISISTLTSDALAETLDGLTPLSLKGPELLKRLRDETGQWLPVSPRDADEIAAATAEICGLMDNSQQLAERLEKLSPVPLEIIQIAEFPI